MKIELRLEELIGFLIDGRTSIHAATITHEQANAAAQRSHLSFWIWWSIFALYGSDRSAGGLSKVVNIESRFRDLPPFSRSR
jgi:hypothetical protein